MGHSGSRGILGKGENHTRLRIVPHKNGDHEVPHGQITKYPCLLDACTAEGDVPAYEFVAVRGLDSGYTGPEVNFKCYVRDHRNETWFHVLLHVNYYYGSKSITVACTVTDTKDNVVAFTQAGEVLLDKETVETGPVRLKIDLHQDVERGGVTYRQCLVQFLPGFPGTFTLDTSNIVPASPIVYKPVARWRDEAPVRRQNSSGGMDVTYTQTKKWVTTTVDTSSWSNEAFRKFKIGLDATIGYSPASGEGGVYGHGSMHFGHEWGYVDTTGGSNSISIQRGITVSKEMHAVVNAGETDVMYVGTQVYDGAQIVWTDHGGHVQTIPTTYSVWRSTNLSFTHRYSARTWQMVSW